MGSLGGWWLTLSSDERIAIVLNIKARVSDLREEASDSPGRRETEANLYKLATLLMEKVHE